MKSSNLSSRRIFIGKLTATAAVTGLASPLLVNAAPKLETKAINEADTWFKNVKAPGGSFPTVAGRKHSTRWHSGNRK